MRRSSVQTRLALGYVFIELADITRVEFSVCLHTCAYCMSLVIFFFLLS